MIVNIEPQTGIRRLSYFLNCTSQVTYSRPLLVHRLASCDYDSITASRARSVASTLCAPWTLSDRYTEYRYEMAMIGPSLAGSKVHLRRKAGKANAMRDARDCREKKGSDT